MPHSWGPQTLTAHTDISLDKVQPQLLAPTPPPFLTSPPLCSKQLPEVQWMSEGGRVQSMVSGQQRYF